MIRLLLFPLSIVYDIITRIRNFLYDKGLMRSTSFDVPVIGVGNLNVGGSGKTPMVEYLIRLLAKEGTLATLSRGYGRSTTGFRFASELDTAATIGDEPMQMYMKFGPQLCVTVAEERAPAIPRILEHRPAVKAILMDDAFQHRAVVPGISILLTDFSKPFTRDHVLPAGNLRETRKQARRADIIVVTRSPEAPQGREKLLHEIRRYAPNQPVYFAGLRYEPVQGLSPIAAPPVDVILVTAIGSTDHLVNHVQSSFRLVRHFRFADHHVFTPADLAGIVSEHERTGAVILTTEKDATRLRDPQLKPYVDGKPWCYVPIRMYFHENGSEFDEKVLQLIR